MFKGHKTSNQGSLRNNVHHYETIKKKFKAYLGRRERSIQDVVYHILLELNLRRIFRLVLLTQFFQRKDWLKTDRL